MPDLAMCRDHACPAREQCYRYKATPSTRQTYADFERADGQEKCEAFVPMRVNSLVTSVKNMR